MTEPLISILVTTYNRRDLVKRAIDRVLGQTFSDFELVVIDDASTDGTKDYLDFLPDKRLRYIRNEKNIGAEHGDRPHIKRFVNELAKGKYFIYLCSDDYWIPNDLLERQISLFEKYPTLSMVTGGQMSFFAPTNEETFFANALPKGFIYSKEFLEYFSESPITSNIITGARLYDREKFIRSGAMQGDGGKWQAGFEMALAPACYGDHYYIAEPCVFTEIQPYNASFQGTQLSQYLDCIKSIKVAFKQPIIDFPERNLKEVMLTTAKNLSLSYLKNSEHIKSGKKLSYCSDENMSRYVTREDVCKVQEELENE